MITGEVKNAFYKYGFEHSPLADVDITSLKSMGFCADDIFNIGCDMADNEFTTIEEAAEWYQMRKDV